MMFPRLVVFIWLIFWVMSVPLFHIHVPDAIKGPVSLHSRLPHTVFSPDLAGEFSQFFASREHRSGPLDFSKQSLNYSELGFVVLNNNLNILSKTHSGGNPAAFHSAVSHIRVICSRTAEALDEDSHPVISERPPPARAPPICSFHRSLLMV